jgi:hypothetical protein
MTEEIIIDGVNVAGCRHCMYKGFKAFPQCRLELDSFATACTQHKECEYKQLKRLEQENKELKKQHYETLKMLKHEYDGRQRDNEQWFTRCTENHNEDSKIIDKYRSALEEIREVLKFYDDSWVDEKMYPNLHYDNTKAKEGLSRINEVINESN